MSYFATQHADIYDLEGGIKRRSILISSVCCFHDKVEVKVSPKKFKFVTRSILFPLMFNFG